MSIKIYTTSGETIFLENIEWSDLKKDISKRKLRWILYS